MSEYDQVLALTVHAQAVGRAQGLVEAARYIDAAIREAMIVGEALAILIIIRDQFMLMATNSTTTTGGSDAASAE